MIELPEFVTTAIMPALLSTYALAFIAGGIYYLEQQATRVRDLLPQYGPLAAWIGVVALGIGLLSATSIAGLLLGQGTHFGHGALISTAAGISFWIVRIYLDPTPVSRLRNALLALLCALLTLLTAWWTTTL